MKKEKKKLNFFVKAVIYLVILTAIFFGAIFGTKYYFYDSDLTVKQTDLSMVTINKLKLGMNIEEVDLSKYTPIKEVVEKCDYNFKELSIKTNSKGEIVMIIANYKYIKLNVGQEGKIERVSGIFNTLGKNYTTEAYEPEKSNLWKISKYTDTKDKIYFGVVYSRHNNEINKVILSDERIKN